MGLALDALELDGLKRCRTCGGKMIRTTIQAELRKHIGHFLILPQDIHVNEWLRVKLGWL